MMSLSASAKRVQDTLVKLGLTLQVVELPDSTRSAAEAAESIGCSGDPECRFSPHRG